MKSLRVLLAVASCTILTACDESYEGTISLQKPLTLKIKKGELTIPMGEQNAKIKASSSKIKLKLKINGKDSEINFAVPKGQKIKSFNDVNLTPEMSGQPVHLKGAQNSEYSDSAPVQSTESCSFDTYERQCGYETTPRKCVNQNVCNTLPDGTQSCTAIPVCTGGDTNYVCKDVRVTHYGTENVEYYLTYTTTHRKVDIIEPTTQQVIGQFNNTSHDTDKHYTYKSGCYEGRRF